MAPVQDLFGWEQRINLPGSIRRSNWTYRLPMTIERLSAAAIRPGGEAARMAQRTGRV